MRALLYRLRSAARRVRPTERVMLAIAGIAFSLGIAGATVIVLERDKSMALAAEAERGRLLASALESNLARTLGTLDSTLDLLVHQLEEGAIGPDAQQPLSSLAYRSTTLRSLSVLTPQGVVLASSVPGRAGMRIDPATLGFGREILTSLEPGSLQPMRDIGEPRYTDADAQPASTSIPFARAAMVDGRRLILLAMVNPASLFPDYRTGSVGEGGFAAVMDYRGAVLAATPGADYPAGQAYPALPLPGLGEDDRETASFRSVGRYAGASGKAFIINARLAPRYPLVALTGMSEERAIAAWTAGSRNLMWLGLVTAGFALIYTLMLWRVMGNREKIARELGTARDAAEQANAARGVFLSTVSHEIRTPMNAVIGMAGLLQDTPLDAEQQDYVRTIKDSAGVLLAIIDDVLDFSRIDAGKLSIEAEPLQLLPLAEACIDILAIRAREKNLTLMCAVDPALPVRVSGDPVRLRQILLNLLGNAVKFTEAGEVILRVSAAGSAAGRTRVRFEISDTGIGIDRAIVGTLFSPFTQADGSVTRRYGGTGLGLSICKRLVELMGGTIGVSSEPGKGSTFWFELALPTLEPAARAAPTGPRAHVLLAEANPRQADILAACLQSRGIGVTHAATHEEALAHLGARAQDTAQDTRTALVLLAGSGIPGQQLLRALRERDPGLRAVLLSAREDERARAREAGFDAALLMPARQHALLDAVLAVAGRPTAEPPRATADTSRPAARATRHILLAEDNPMNQQVATLQLDRLGYAVHVANNGQEALDMLAGPEADRYELVLMDCQMPVMDGFEATRRIRALEAAGRKAVQIVAMTANAMQGDRERCLQAGMDDYLAKPITRRQLSELLGRRLPLPEPAPGASAGESLPALTHMCDTARPDADGTVQEILIGQFLAHTESVLGQMGIAIAGNDIATAQSLGHRLAGACSRTGATRLGELGTAIELAARAGCAGELPGLYGAMLTEFAQLQAHLGRPGAAQADRRTAPESHAMHAAGR